MADQASQNPDISQDRFRYTGSSMLPTFKPGQVLYIRPEGRDIQVGDIVVFRRGKENVVHRVYQVEPGLIHTRGDNNPRSDEGPVSLDQVVGVVEKVDDWGKLQPVSGGKKGLWQARLRWGSSALYQRLLPWLGAPYRWLKKRGWIRKVWHPSIERVQFHSPVGQIIKYIHNEKTVASWQPESRRFLCRRPYDLVIDNPIDKTQ